MFQLIEFVYNFYPFNGCLPIITLRHVHNKAIDVDLVST